MILSDLMIEISSLISFSILVVFAESATLGIFLKLNKIIPQYSIAQAMNIMQVETYIVKAVKPNASSCNNCIILNIFCDFRLHNSYLTWASEKNFVKTRNKVTSNPARPGTTFGSMTKLIDATITNIAHIKQQLIMIL